MKTVLIDCSPKKKLSASGFVAGLTGLFLTGQKQREKLRTKADHGRILDALKDADNVVFAMPLYVDGVPSHVLPFLRAMERHCRENSLSVNVYVVANNGFIEGRQNEPLMQVMENFCQRGGLRWCGGLGIGGGVMMNVMRILILVYFAVAVLNLLLAGLREGNFLQTGPLVEFGKQVLEVLFFGCGILTFDIWLASCINRGKPFGKHYTRIMLPSFLFILAADVFFTVLSLFQGGIFRGWLARKAPTDGGRRG